MTKLGGLLFLLITCSHIVFAQQRTNIEDNHIYEPYIRTVQCYNSQKEQSLPVIALNSGELLHFSFDDLEGGSKNYWYSIEHFTADWKPSGISTVDFVASFAEDRIVDYAYSSGTLQKYTHYSLSLPNEQVKMKTSGNYLLKVYENGQVKKPVLTQRFYVVENLVNLQVEVRPSAQVAERNAFQKINFSISHPGLTIQNPNRDIKVLVMQNGNPGTARDDSKPSFIKPGSLVYNDLKSNDFSGGNEFRKFDTRSLRYPAAQVQKIYKDSTFNAVLIPDLSRNTQKYSSGTDENGSFFIRNQDGRDDHTESDYVWVWFTLQTPAAPEHTSLYVAGRFNNYVLNEAHQLKYNPEKRSYEVKMLLKQGIYDYKYILKNLQTAVVNDTLLEGSFFETSNAYQVFVYYRKPGSRWDELIGYLTTQTDTLLSSHGN
ncbi:DUF5103 domain-containing protein [Pedobacter immunditicola]|uniref:type IX secretion system plug protein n=1 Tax=Pedobacter immunditicola TaxID=3133440 RepID=UPI0030A91862